MEDDPGLEIFVIGLFKSIFGGPFHIVTFVTGIDTGLSYLKMVHDLDCLQLNESCSHKIGGNNILGELGMWTCCRSHRCCTALGEHINCILPVILVELGLIYGKNGIMVSELSHDTGKKFSKRNRSHQICHTYSPFDGYRQI